MTVYDENTEAEGSPRAGVRPLTAGMRWLLLVASVLVFIIGIPLFLLSGQTDRYFAWTIAVPLTAAFLGAGYWSSFFIEFVAAREREWANARVAVPAVFVFTLLTLVATLIHLSLFHLGSRFAAITQVGTWIWMAVYVSVPILLAVLWAVQIRLPGGDPPGSAPMSGLVRLAIYLLAAEMLAVGVALFVAPLVAGVLWPWGLTPLTGRAVGAWLIGLGVAAAHMALERDWRRVLPVSAMFTVFGALELVVLLRFFGKLNWSGARAWIYLLFQLSVLAVGLYGLYAARGQKDRLRRGMHNATSDESQGASRHIEDVIAQMESLLEPMQRNGNPKQYFLGTYLRTTRAVSDELASGNFLDPAWVERWDVFFADLYLNALEAWNTKGTPAEPWRVAFAAGTDLPVLRHVLLGKQ